MDKVDRYRQIIQRVIDEAAAMLSQGNQVSILPVCDPVHDQYLMISLGRQNNRREHAIVFHAQLRDGKFLIEDDGTEEGIANLLIEAGVPKEDIRLSWASSSGMKDDLTLAA